MIRTFKMCFPGGKPKCMTLSYDDAAYDDIRLCGLMKQYGIAGTFNINSELSENEYGLRMPFDKAINEYMSSELFEVATHGATHPFLDKIPKSAAADEILSDRKAIENRTGKLCRGHAYPYGTYNDDVIDVLRACGICYARTVKSAYGFDIPKSWLEWHPTCHHNDEKLFELLNNFLCTEAKYKPMMFYLWGHSYEFSRDNNWDVIEKVFKEVSGNCDIWFATNIQVYDYVQAYNSLVYSLDCKTVYNPTATDIYVNIREFETAGTKKYHTELIPAGKTIKL